MKNINNLFLYFGLFLSLMLVGCATSSKSKPEAAPVVSPAELQCRSSCKLMAACSGKPFSNHDLLICGRECLAAHPVVRSAVTECSLRWLKKCSKENREKMNSCVQKKLAPYQQ